MGYNRVHLKQHHTLQEDILTYDYCSDGINERPFSTTRKPTLENSSASKRKQELSEDKKNINSSEKKIEFKGKQGMEMREVKANANHEGI